MYLQGKLNELPAIQKGLEFIQLFHQHQVVVVEGPTGSGKTMVFPTLLAEVMQGQGQVICTQNRRILCDGAAAFISEQMGEPDFAGVKHKEIKKLGKKLTFKTTGTVLSELNHNPMLWGVSVVIVDEIHECTVEQNVLLGHLKRIAKTNPNFKIVLMSATLGKNQKEHISQFFQHVGFLQVEGRTFPIETIYSGHTFENGDNWFSVKNQVLGAVASNVVSLVKKGANGTVLAFLPGKAEINQVQALLTQSLQGVPVYRLFRGVEEQEKKQAVKGNEVKVVLATDIARSGLTIEHCVAVVSSGYTRNSIYESKYGVKGLETVSVDKPSLKQEGGRTGRTCNGKHIIIGTEEKFSKPIYRVEDLSYMMLSILASDLDLRTFEWFYSPSESEFQETHAFLESIGAINRSGITELGRAILSFQIDLLLGKLLVESKKLGVEEQGATLVSLILNEQHVHGLDFLQFGYEKTKEIEKTKNELLLTLEKIDVPQEKNDNPLTTAIIRTFGLYASVYVPQKTYYKEEDWSAGQTIENKGFMRSFYQRNFIFNCEGIFGEFYDDVVIVPLQLFSRDSRIISNSYIMVDLEEIKAELNDTSDLENLKRCVDKKKKTLREKNIQMYNFGDLTRSLCI